MSEIITLEVIDHVTVKTSEYETAIMRNWLDMCKRVSAVTDHKSNALAIANANGCAAYLNDARRSADKSKLQLLQLIRQVEDAHVTFTRDLENEMHRLRNLSGAYNAAKEQAERKDNVV